MTAYLYHPVVLLALAYLGATALFQFRPLSTRLLGLDAFGILPRWKFFIPQAKRFDLRLQLRGRIGDHPWAPWVPVSFFPPRRIVNWLWFPEQHRGEIVWLSAQRLAHKALRGKAEIDSESVAHQTLVRYLQPIAKKCGFETFEFTLIRRDADADPTGHAIVTSRHRTA